MRIVPYAQRALDYVRETLSIADAGPPWHRGLVAMANILLSSLFGLWLDVPGSILLAPALGLFFTMADTEGPLLTRLAALAWTFCFTILESFIGFFFPAESAGFAVAFIIFTTLAGLVVWAGPPFIVATRLSIVAGLIVNRGKPPSEPLLASLILTIALFAAITRCIEFFLRPDRAESPYASAREALKKLRSLDLRMLRFTSFYTLTVATGWALGHTFDSLHPTWVATTVLVVMWPDSGQSFQRLFQRLVGTMAGSIVALALTLVQGMKPLLFIVTGLSFFVPHFVRRNYWLHSALMVVLVLTALELTARGGFAGQIIRLRILDVMLGCALAFVGTILAFPYRKLSDRKNATGDSD